MTCARVAFVTALAVLGPAAPAWAEAPLPPDEFDPETIAAAAAEARFTECVLRGDRAWAADKASDAVMAYSEALRIRPDPLIAGRLGVALVALGRPAQAADLLHDAITRGHHATPEERQRFVKAYDAARALVCWVDVTLSEVPERTTLDGNPINPRRRNEFFQFMTPGPHEIRATLDGFHEGIASFTACKGGDMQVSVTLRPLSPVLGVEPQYEPAAIAAPRLAETHAKPLGDPSNGIVGAVGMRNGKPLPRQEDPYGYEDEEKKSKARFSLGGGPMVVFGVASWSPAVGAVVSARVKPHENFSIDLDVRGAWSTSDIGDRPIRAMTVGGLLGLCGHWKWAWACAAGHLGMLKVDFAVDPFKGTSHTLFRPGFGGRVGVDFPLSDSLAIRLAGDVLGLSSGTRIIVNGRLLVDQPAVMVGTHLAGVWTF